MLEKVLLLAENCGREVAGKLRTQNDLDAISCKLDLILRDCEVLIKVGIHKEEEDPAKSILSDLRQLLGKIQIGDADAKYRAFDDLLKSLREDLNAVAPLLRRNDISAVVHQLTAPSPKLREKAAAAVCLLAESRICDAAMVSEGVLPSLVKLAESGSFSCREKAISSLEKLSMKVSAARDIVDHGGVNALMSVCMETNSRARASAAATVRNISFVGELLQELAQEGVIKLAIDLLNDNEVDMETKNIGAELLRNFTAREESLRISVAMEGGIEALIDHLGCASPEESAVTALRNLVGFVSEEEMVSLGVLPRLAYVLENGSLEARVAAAWTIQIVCNNPRRKKMAGSYGCLPFLISMLDTKARPAREAAAAALSSLMSCEQNAREVRRNPKSVPGFVQLLDANPKNGAKKEAVACLLLLSGCKKSRKMMVSYGAIGYLKKLSDLDIPGAKSLLQRLESSSWWTMK